MALVKAVSTKGARVLFSSLPIFEELNNMSGIVLGPASNGRLGWLRVKVDSLAWCHLGLHDFVDVLPESLILREPPKP